MAENYDGSVFNSFAAGTYQRRFGKQAELGMEDTIFGDWLHPAQGEERRLGQQIMMEQILPSVKMQALKAAGVNPLTAAAGLAGSSSSSSSPAAESVNPIGDVAGAVGAISSGYGAVAHGITALEKKDSEIRDLDASAEERFANIGLTNAQTQGVMTDNKYKDEDWRASLNVKRQQFENMKQQYSNMQASHDEIMKHIDEMQSQIELNGSQQDYFDMMSKRIDEDLRWQKAVNDFCIANNLYIKDSGLDGYIYSMVMSGADMSQFDSFIQIYSEYRGKVQAAVSRAQYSQEALFAQDISNARRNGENASDLAFGRIGSTADLAGRIASLGTNLITSSGQSIVDYFKYRHSGKDIRKELTMCINNAYDQLDRFPDDNNAKKVISDLQIALQLSNKELVEWASKNWK